MSTIELSIEGMHCAACVRRVRAALATVPGAEVRDVQVGHAALELADDARVDAVREGARRAVTDAGFTVSSS
jgi:copper chaperone CopZ